MRRRLRSRTAAYLVTDVAAREQSHRRAVLIGIAALIVLSTAPVFGHHLALGADSLLAGRDHLGALCLIALHYLLAPVHGVFHLVVLGGIALATIDRMRAWYRVRSVLAPLASQTPTPGDVFWGAAEAAWLDPRRVRVVSGLPNPAFTAGWLRPAVYVERELAQQLPFAELAAVLAHERAHVERRDPLRLSAVRFLARTLFWLPALSRLADDLADEAEVLADDAAARGRPLVLASALLAIAGAFGSRRLPEAVVGACSDARPDLLERRIRRLAGENASVHSHLTRRSLAFAAMTLGVVFSSSIAVVHPLPTHHAGVPVHCTHAHSWALSHLFCRGGAGDHHMCPHAEMAAAQ
ncbi:MAG: M56 family metallopeptidase [Gemmatimonadaceae bacterium]